MSDDLKQDELATLKARADQLNITYHPSIGVDKLREKVAAAIAGDESSKDDEPEKVEKTAKVEAPVEETEPMRMRRLKRESLELVRVRLTCMNPSKKEWSGEIFTVGNNLIGTVSKFVPFNLDEGWHVPRIMLEMLQSRQVQTFVNEKSRNGITTRRGKLIKEFAIEILPPLTAVELKELAQRQAMAAGQAD